MSLYISNTTIIFFLPILPSINTPTFISHNLQCNLSLFFVGNLVKVLCLMIISFHSLICVQLAKTKLILKRREYILNAKQTQKYYNVKINELMILMHHTLLHTPWRHLPVSSSKRRILDWLIYKLFSATRWGKCYNRFVMKSYKLKLINNNLTTWKQQKSFVNATNQNIVSIQNRSNNLMLPIMNIDILNIP